MFAKWSNRFNKMVIYITNIAGCNIIIIIIYLYIIY